MIVIPMAGLSTRFYKAGYKSPKYMLKINNNTLFSLVVKSFKYYFNKEFFLFICKVEQFDIIDFINKELSALGLSKEQYHVCILDKETEGQAETVYKGLLNFKNAYSEPLTIFNIDTIRPNFTHPTINNEIDGNLGVFKGKGTHWSFVKPKDPNFETGAVIEVAEKQPISNFCSTGLYYFKSISFYNDLFESTVNIPSQMLQGGERYIAPLYNLAIQSNLKIAYNLIGISEVFFCGTPEEYLELKNYKFEDLF